MKLLIAEDNATVRQVIKTVMALPDDEILECADGRTAVDHYGSFHPDFVLMDIEMKILDGIAATRLICAADPKARVIIVTNHDTIALREAAQQAGAYGYFLKDDLFEVRRLIHPPQ